MYVLLLSASTYLSGLASFLISEEQALYFLYPAALRPNSNYW